MDLFNMECYISVAKTKNLSRAAEELGLTQPAISAQLKKLEREMGTKLLERSSRGVTMTPTGEIVYEGFRKIIGTYRDLEWKVMRQMQERECLRIGYEGPANWANIQELFGIFLNIHPELELKLVNGDWADLLEKTEAGELDLAFLDQTCVRNATDLNSVPLFFDYSCFAMHRSHPFSGKKIITPQEANSQVIYYNMKTSASMQYIFHQLQQSGLSLANIRCVDGRGTSVAMARATGGLAALPRSFKIVENDADLVYVDYESKAVRMDYVVAWRENNNTDMIRDFVDQCVSFDWRTR